MNPHLRLVQPVQALITLTPYALFLYLILSLVGDSLVVSGLGREQEHPEIDWGTEYIGEQFANPHFSISASLRGDDCILTIDNQSSSLYCGQDGWLKVYDGAGREISSCRGDALVRTNDNFEKRLSLPTNCTEPIKVVCVLLRRGQIDRFSWSTDKDFEPLADMRAKAANMLDNFKYWYDDLNGRRVSLPSVEVYRNEDGYGMQGVLIPNELLDTKYRAKDNLSFSASFSDDRELKELMVNGESYPIRFFQNSEKLFGKGVDF